MSADHLYDLSTGKDLGPATPEQVATAYGTGPSVGPTGVFLVDADGRVIESGESIVGAYRFVYVASGPRTPRPC